MEKINGLYNDLNDLANAHEEKLDRLDQNMDNAFESAKAANKQLRKSKPTSIWNMRLIIAALVLTLVVFFFISHYFFAPLTATRT